MPKKAAFIHTVPSLVDLFNNLSGEFFPRGVEIFHIADELLLKTVLAEGRLTPFIFRRLADHVIAAVEGGACMVQVTCSSISPCVEAARPFVTVPVLKIDEPMVDHALTIGDRIGIAATVPTTLKPTTDLVYEQAHRLGKQVVVDSVLCEGAFKALNEGDGETHDRIILHHLKDLVLHNDVVLLAQASMARVAETLPKTERKVPILSSPRLAVEKAARILTTIP